MPKDFISVADWSADDLLRMLERAQQLRRLHRADKRPQTLQGRTLAMYFEKPSLRTHVTFEAGMAQLGGHAVLLRPEQVGIGTRETPRDVALNLSRWVDGIMARTFSHDLVCELAKHATIPIINGLTDLLHPCQAMADLQTIAGVMNPRQATLAYVGDGNNVAHSLILLAAVLGMRIRVATPASHRPDLGVMSQAEDLGAESGAEIFWTDDPLAAVKGVDFIYTDTWTSMGQEDEAEQRREIFARYQVNQGLIEHAPDARLMHCLPAHRGEEITGELLDGPRSLVYEQAENRLHSQKAVLEAVMLTSSAP
ncbi:MAG: ornithine carbamoyltransferase [Deltaproteobacteria bacterium]|jgi:ornithine carbamoyltransferase|nr:ornithine carbamoyltransferase [Deltaproteobacteria bacterium]MBW2383415.1 ornithine carbamoyltransferase [Deltaproteobacteria bacterium]